MTTFTTAEKGAPTAPVETLFEALATTDDLATSDPQMGLTRRPDGQTTPDK